MGLDPAPHDEAVVLSPAWLGALLGDEVVGVTVVERLETVATKVRFGVELAAGGTRSLCAKGFFNPAMRRPGGQATEAIFYDRIGPTLDVRIPPCVHAGIDGATGHGLVVMEDLKVAGATFLDPRSSYTAEQAAQSLEQLAALHASTWERAESDLPAELADRLPKLASLMDAAMLQDQFDDGRAADVPTSARDGGRVIRAVAALAALDGPRCVVHGDVHTGNLYDVPGEGPGLIDWQVVQHGSWALDVSYHLATALEPDVRSDAERELLTHYLGCLAGLGVDPPAFDEAWWHYRAHLPYGFFLWGITRQVERPVIDHLTTRLGTAVAEHRSLDLVEA